MFSVGNGVYTDYRIPAMVISARGEIYIAYECRTAPSDWAKIDLRLIKSTDGGASFKQLLLLRGNGETLHNPTLIANGNEVHLLYCEDYRRVFHMQSTDGGGGWSEPAEITEIFAHLPHTVVATGPGHGAVTPEGTMVVPVWLACNPEDLSAHKPSFLTTIYSKNHGKTWRRGEVLAHDNLFDPNETAIALTENGSVLLSIRNRHPVCRQRYWASSPSGYGAWEYRGFDERFPDPHCMGSLCNGDGKLFFSNCEATDDRVNLIVKVSNDDLKTFTRTLVSEKGGYSDIAYGNGTLYVLYETSDKYGEERRNHTLHLKKYSV